MYYLCIINISSVTESVKSRIIDFYPFNCVTNAAYKHFKLLSASAMETITK